jgi:hypothetical protein
MTQIKPITFVVAVNDRRVLEENLLASTCVHAPHEVLIQEGFPSAALAYNDALLKATNNLIVFVHQDVFLPETWIGQLEESLEYLYQTDPSWGVLGCWGARADGSLLGHVYSSGLGVLGACLEHPERVQTLDEIVLICKKSSGLSFDARLPHFHFYGTDICMRAAARGLNCYAMSGFCVHNTRQILRLPREFYACYAHIKRSWKDRLPIQTSCIRITRCDIEVFRRKLEAFCRPAFLNSRMSAPRVTDPRQITKELECSNRLPIVAPINDSL